MLIKPYFSRGSGRNLKVLNFTAVNTKNPFSSKEAKPQPGKTQLALRALDRLSLAPELDQSSLAWVPPPLGLAEGVKTSLVATQPQLDLEILLQMTLECVMSYPQSQRVTANCHQEGVMGN